MSTSVLYHGWSLTEHVYLKTEYQGGVVWYHVERKAESRRCPACHSKDFTLAGKKVRTWKSLPIGLHPVSIVGHLHRLDCRSCGLLRWEDSGIGDPVRRYARPLGRYALALARVMALSDVCELTGLSWPTVKQIVKEDLERKAEKIKVKHVRYLAIDEVSHKCRQRPNTAGIRWESRVTTAGAKVDDPRALLQRI